MKFNSIEEIEAHKFVGNHAADAEAFNAIEAWAEEQAKLVLRAFNHITVEGMGCPATDEAEFLDALRAFQQLRRSAAPARAAHLYSTSRGGSASAHRRGNDPTKRFGVVA